jgi:hypothetical protein
MHILIKNKKNEMLAYSEDQIYHDLSRMYQYKGRARGIESSKSNRKEKYKKIERKTITLWYLQRIIRGTFTVTKAGYSQLRQDFVSKPQSC